MQDALQTRLQLLLIGCVALVLQLTASLLAGNELEASLLHAVPVGLSWAAVFYGLQVSSRFLVNPSALLGISAFWSVIAGLSVYSAAYFTGFNSYWVQTFGVQWLLPVFGAMTFLILSLIAQLFVLTDKSQRAFERNQVQQDMVNQASLQELQYKFQPHFLYNSLNTINALVGFDPQEARRVVITLSDLLRRSVAQHQAPFHPLSEELKVIEQYLSIEQVRFGSRLNVIFEVSDALTQVPIPPFLLQPVVENAIKYGLYGTIDDVTILIRAATDERGMVRIVISNPVSDAGGTKPVGTRSGLAILNKRLALSYGRNDLITTSKQDGQFITTILLPK